MSKVFISWSGNVGKKIAEGLKETLFDHSDLTAWVSSQDIETGGPWHQEIERALEGAQYAIGIMTRGASQRPWLNFEAGYLIGHLGNFRMLLFGEALSGPLSQYQAIDGNNQSAMVRLWSDMLLSLPENKGRDADAIKARAAAWISFRWDDWQKKRREVEDLEDPFEDLAEAIRAGRNLLERNAALHHNPCFRHVVSLSLRETGERLRNLQSDYSVPAAQYPHHLIALQNDLQARVRAIALVEMDESFWPGKQGREILRTARPENERVFVFASPDQFDKFFDHLKQHADKYGVRAAYVQRLSREMDLEYIRDFSIIEVEGSSVLAEYIDTDSGKAIRFTTDSRVVAEREKILQQIVNSAEPIARQDPREPDQIRDIVFGLPEMSRYPKHPVEMSRYIEVANYDRYEGDHAYYQEMMTEMMACFRRHRGDARTPYRILEMGAGTGIFTRRLIQELGDDPDLEKVVAMEIDWECCNCLKRNLRGVPKVEALEADSRTHDPDGEKGKFDYIFSSFAEHHIKRYDKDAYFRNVRNNLRNENSRFIVGDEFLRDHDIDDPNERHRALHDYHQHIIAIAEAAGHHELVKLEQDALASGLNPNGGDFKVSCRYYEELLEKNSLLFDPCLKIGPPNREDIGGVFVYVARLASRQRLR